VASEAEIAAAWDQELATFKTVIGARFPGLDERAVHQAATGVLLLVSLPSNDLLSEAMRYIVDELHERGIPVLPRTSPTVVPDADSGEGGA
jgi:hypothetical protein